MLRTAATVIGARGLGSLANALMFVWVAREISLAEVGRLGAITSAMTFLFLITDLGLATYMPRQWARGFASEVRRGLRINAQASTVGIAIACSAIVVLQSADILGMFGYSYVLLALALGLEKNTDTGLSLAIAVGARYLPLHSLLIRRLSSVAIFGSLLALEVQPLAGFCIALACGGVFGQLHYRRWARRFGRMGNGASTASVLKASTSFALANISGSARLLDTAIIASVVGVVGAGPYSAAVRLVNPFALVPAALTEVLVPHSAAMRGVDARKLGLRLVLAGLSALVVCGVGAFFAEDVVRLILGSRYGRTSPIFAVLLLGLPFVFLSSPLGSVLQGQGKERLVAWNGLVFGVLLLGLIALGAFVGGGLAAAAAIGLVYAFKCVVLGWSVHRLKGGEHAAGGAGD